jgi:HPt (histidine-containing phosphotransfer) domain-containing protein
VTSNKKIVSLDFLKKQTHNNKAEINEMIHLFCLHNPVDLQNIEEAILQKDFTSIYKKVHALQNSIGFFGLGEHIGQTLLDMEFAARNQQDIEVIRNGFSTVKDTCNIALSELKNTVI